jgi:GTP-binding protein
VGRSNVGKSSLINALVRRRLARTSGAPGKTRLANVYRVRRGASAELYLVDLPGYGFARGDSGALAAAIRAYFGQETPGARRSALLLVDARHPGLESDIAAWRWLAAVVRNAAIVATKIDKLARGQRIRATGELESVFERPVLPVSAETGEGMNELWKLIDKLANSRSNNRPHPSRPPRAAATRRQLAKR